MSRGLKTMVIYLKLTMWNYLRWSDVPFSRTFFKGGRVSEFKLNHDIICYGSVWGIFYDATALIGGFLDLLNFLEGFIQV